MNINRDNYENFFLLYVDNELSQEYRKAVEEFIRLNPDLMPELAQLQQLTLKPDAASGFAGKYMLLRPEDPALAITPSNCEEFFVLYADNELTNEGKAAVENFVYHHPGFQSAFELIELACVSPDNSIRFREKELLYRKEAGPHVVPLRWWMAAAAIVLLLTGLFWLNAGRRGREIAARPGQSARAPGIAPLNTDPPTDRMDNKNLVMERPPASGQIIAKRSAGSEQPVTRRTQTVKKMIKTWQGQNGGGTQENTIGAVYTQQAVAVKNSNKLPEVPAIIPRNEAAVITLPGSGAIAGIGAAVGKPQVNAMPVTAAETEGLPESIDSNNKIAILNTELKRPGSLKGMLRKASRFIAKKTNRDGNDIRGGIHIGGFEIAVR